MFKVKDLMVDVLARGAGGGAMMPTPTEPTPPSPISPVAAVAAFEHKFAAIDQIAKVGDKADLNILDNIALDVGRALVGVRLAALCSEDMATCANNERISPWANQGIGVLRDVDFALLHDQVLQLSAWANDRGDLLEKRAAENKKDLIARFENALDFLKSN